MKPYFRSGGRGICPPAPDRLFQLCRPRSWRCRRLLLLAVVGLSVWGCGYTLVGSRSSPLYSRTAGVAVVPFTNETREPVVEHFMTAALRQALLQRKGFVLKSAANAAMQVRGSVQDFHTTALSYDPGDNVLAYRLQADVQVVVLDGQETQPLLRQDIRAQAEYLVSRTGDVRETAVAREAALSLLARQFADRCSAWLTIALLEDPTHATD